MYLMGFDWCSPKLGYSHQEIKKNNSMLAGAWIFFQITILDATKLAHEV